MKGTRSLTTFHWKSLSREADAIGSYSPPHRAHTSDSSTVTRGCLRRSRQLQSIGSKISKHSSSKIGAFCWRHMRVFRCNLRHRFERYGCHNLRLALQNDQYLESPTLLQSPIHIREPS